MRSLCWDCIDVCNAYFVIFSSKISLTFVILFYCDAITCWAQRRENETSASKLYLCVFTNWDVQKHHFLDDRRSRDEMTSFYQTSMYEFTCSLSLLCSASTRLRNVIWFCSLFKWTWSEAVYVSIFSVSMFVLLKTSATWRRAWFWRASSLRSLLDSSSSLPRWCQIDASNAISDLTTAESICLAFAKVAPDVKALRRLSASILVAWSASICRRCEPHRNFVFSWTTSVLYIQTFYAEVYPNFVCTIVQSSVSRAITVVNCIKLKGRESVRRKKTGRCMMGIVGKGCLMKQKEWKTNS